MDQHELIHEDWRDSLRHLVKALGGVEAVGADLFPAKTRKAAGTWLADCLNPERPAKLDLEEVLMLLRMGHQSGIHIGIDFLCDEIGYSRPAPVDPQDQEAEIAKQMQNAIGAAAKLVSKWERIQQAKPANVSSIK